MIRVHIQDLINKKNALTGPICKKIFSSVWKQEAEITIRITTSSESQELNHHYRNQNKPTNILSFNIESNKSLIGNLVLCHDIVKKEAKEQNKKITHIKDLGSKEKFFGIGYDIHKMSPGYNLYIGGIKISSKYGAVGHSDGDSLLHALIDSFMGAARLGDIGTLFPNNKKYKGIRSTKLIREIILKLNMINLKISSIDLNIILQSPNLKNYKEKIKKNISKLCLIKLDKINIKAKTTDKLGIIGKNKALACEVISTLENA